MKEILSRLWKRTLYYTIIFWFLGLTDYGRLFSQMEGDGRNKTELFIVK
jgi:hypothetical protein